MTAFRYPSRVFPFGRALFAALDAKTFPKHEGLDNSPEVMFSHTQTDASEGVCVALNVDESSAEWKRFSPAGRDETITFDVEAWSTVPGMTSLQLWDRLEVFAGVIESVVYNFETNKVTPLNVPGEVLAGLSSGSRPYVTPTKEGFIGSVVVPFRFLASI